MKAKSQERATYNVSNSDEDRIIAQALEIIARRLKREAVFSSPKVVGEYFVMRSHELQREVFSVAFLDAQNRLIAIEELFHGTLDQAAVYPREIVRSALNHNAAAVVLHHNHPSGKPDPSRADELLTEKIKSVLETIEVRTLDHIITGGADWHSMAEHGQI